MVIHSGVLTCGSQKQTSSEATATPVSSARMDGKSFGVITWPRESVKRQPAKPWFSICGSSDALMRKMRQAAGFM